VPDPFFRGDFLRLISPGAGRVSIIGCLLLTAALSQPQTTATTPVLVQTISHTASSESKSTKSTGASTPAISRRSKKSRKSSAHRRTRGQQKIDPTRAREIQEALIREHYLDGQPSGVWNDATQKAMQRYQADNNWQSKTTPDARALIKLGLGPDHDHLLNPESAMTSQPQAAHSTSVPPPSPAVDPTKQPR
jgi:hypothetical protein